jgi:uncharacterized membrane protein
MGTTDEKYSTLRTYIKILEIIGYIVIVIGAIIALIGLVKLFDGSAYQSSVGFSILMSGIGMAISGFALIAFSQLICVWIDTEENTRKIVGLLENKK